MSVAETNDTRAPGRVRRPSSPRRFFARLYGHLETRTDEVKTDNASSLKNSTVSTESGRIAMEQEKRELLNEGDIEITRGMRHEERTWERLRLREQTTGQICKKQTIEETGKIGNSNVEHPRNGRTMMETSASQLTPERFFHCRGISAPYPAASAAAATAAAAAAFVLPVGLHHLTHIGHQFVQPTQLPNLRGNPEIEAHFHGFSAFRESCMFLST